MVRLVTASIIAGALAAPLSPVATPLTAAGAGLLAAAGWFVWRWSRLAELSRPQARRGLKRFVQPLVWMGLGLAVGLFMLAVIRLVIEPAVPNIASRMAAAGALPVWRRVAIIYVAAVGEELIFRLLLLSAIAGVGARLLRRPGPIPTRGIVSAANGVSALAFAAIHLPAWSAAPLSLALSLSVLTLNGIGGVVLGYMFVRRGIGAAIWTHAGADCAIQLIGPLTG